MSRAYTNNTNPDSVKFHSINVFCNNIRLNLKKKNISYIGSSDTLEYNYEEDIASKYYKPTEIVTLLVNQTAWLTHGTVPKIYNPQPKFSIALSQFY